MPWKNGQNTSVLYWKRGQRDTKNESTEKPLKFQA